MLTVTSAQELPLPEQPSVFLPTPTWVFPTATMTLEPTATATPVSRVPLLWSILATLFFAFAATTLVLTILFALYLNRVRRATDVAQKQALAWQHLATTLSRRERRNSNGKKGPKDQRTFRDDWLAARPTFREPGEAPVPEPFSFAEEHVAFPIVKASSSGLEHGQPDLPHNDQGRLGSTPGVVPSSALPLHSAFGGGGVGPDARNASEEAGHGKPCFLPPTYTQVHKTLTCIKQTNPNRVRRSRDPRKRDSRVRIPRLMTQNISPTTPRTKVTASLLPGPRMTGAPDKRRW